MVKTALQNSAESMSGSASASRRKAENDDAAQRVAKKPRTRVSYSCGECHRRKQKCDRQMPCSHCIARKVPELCKAYAPGKNDQDLHARLARLEQIIENALPHLASNGSVGDSEGNGASDRHRSPSPSADDDNRSQPDDEPTGIYESGEWYGVSASDSIAAPAVLEKLQHVVEPGPSRQGGSRARSLSVDQLPQDIFQGEPSGLLAAGSDPSPAEKLKILVQDCGVAPHKISELVNELPPRRLADKLIDHYFAAINWTRYPLSEREFRASYTAIYAEGIAVNPNDVRFLPLLFLVLALAAKLAPESIVGDARTRKLISSRYYWSSRRSLLIVAAIQPDCIEMVLTRLLSARFLVMDRKMTECWSQLGAAVRTAQALGLHRDCANLHIDPLHVQYRRRVWSYLYHADRSYALVLGRPSAIQDDYTSTLPPLNIEDDNSLQLRNPLPITTPTNMTYIVLRHSLAGIMGRMVHHFQKVHSPSHYQDVLALDDELTKFIDSIPPYYSLEPDTSLDQTLRYLPAHRFLLVTEALFLRISLHRPYLLRRLGSDRYLRSRDACFECAMKDFKVRRTFLDTTTKDFRDPVTSAYRWFQTAMISGIYLVLYPRGKDAETMNVILDEFIQSYEATSELDETTRRELKIIQFLKRKASQSGNATDDMGTSISADKPHSDAHLLLGLHQPGSWTRKAPPHVTGPSFPNGSAEPVPSTSSARYNNSSGFQQQSIPGLSTVQQLQQSETSPQSGKGSPGNEDESSAQSLLDQWCNVFNGGPTMDGLSSGTVLPWATPGIAPPGIPDFSSWLNAGTSNSPLLGNEASPMPDVEGSDWSYWETLVNQIRSGPVA